MSSFHEGHDHPQVRPRRQFLRKSFFFFGALATVPTGSNLTEAHEKRNKPDKATFDRGPSGHIASNPSDPNPGSVAPFRAFDAHLHCPSDEVGGAVVLGRPQGLWQLYPVTKTFAEFVVYLDRTGVQRGIINSVRSQEAKSPAEFIAGNREVARYIEKYKGRFLGACVVNPLFIDEALKEIEYCKKQLGFNWVGELCNYVVPYEYASNEFELLVEQVSKLNMVLDVHTQLEEMHYIIQKFPRATIVFSQFSDEGNNIFPRIELVAAHPNTYIDTSGDGHDRVGMLEYAVKTVGEDRILFGSDFSMNCPATVLGRIQNAFLTDEQKQKILSGNLEALLRKLGS
jgi:predicted TIM-barrel fold metal-dependent hydrolase